ncbi:MAG: glycosyltransferase family 39 protein [Anaerolineae bacterium]|nr:glycosyltransferase family 39 protein [Anaerolineae bacterium]
MMSGHDSDGAFLMALGEATQSRRQGTAISPYRLKVWLVLILLVASAFRFIGLDNFPSPAGATPPGLEHDEVAHWLINQDILAGNHAVYFTEAYGHEALYHYVQAGFGALVGDHALALRLPSAYFGILLVAVAFALGRKMFGPREGLWSAAFLAVLFWPVFYSRLALRAISLPVLSGLAACFWWQAMSRDPQGPGATKGETQPDNSRMGQLAFALAGLFAGLSLHTYMAARAVPIFFALYTAYLFLWHRPSFRRTQRGLLLFWLVLAVVATPLVIFLATNPNSEVRIAEVDAPLRSFLAGDIGPVLDNALKIAAMFGIRGDPLWRQNVAGRPVFDPIMGALFYAGVLLSLWRLRDRRYAFLLLWLATAVIPSLVTIDAPSSIRIINLLPVLMLFPLAVIHKVPHLSTVREKFSTELLTRLVDAGLIILLLFTAFNTWSGLWQVWPRNEEVRFVWQAALTEAAAYLDSVPESGPVAVGGWTPETMDAPTMALTLRREDLSLRFFDPSHSLILPAPANGQNIRVVRPAILPLAPYLQSLVSPWEQDWGEFALYAVPVDANITPAVPLAADFGELQLTGYDVVDGCAAGEACTVATYWRVMEATGEPRRVFLHAVDGAGEVVSQDDRLGAPAEYWQPGDQIVQLLTVPTTTSELRLGVYDPRDGRRLSRETGEEFVILDVAK